MRTVLLYRFFRGILFLLIFFGNIVSTAYAQSEMQKTRIAILYFENNAIQNSFTPLSKGLCDMMISDFNDSKCFIVVERTRLEDVIKELKLTESNNFDSTTTAKIGKLLGAEYLVLGSYFEFMGTFRIDARLVKVETGKIIASAGFSGKVDEFEQIEKKVVAELQKKIVGITRNNSVSKGISLNTATQYGVALNKIDSGDTKSAVTLLRDIVDASPDFALAKEMLQKVSK